MRLRATHPIFVIITVKDGLIIRGDQYTDRREALKAAGLDA